MHKSLRGMGLCCLSLIVWFLFVLSAPTFLVAQQTLTLADVEEGLPQITGDEPLAESFSAVQAAEYLDHYGVTVATLAVGLAPDGYAETAQAQAGLEKVREYFKNNPPKSLHHRAMLAWCSIRVDGIFTPQQRQTTLDELLALQLEDGGWSTSGFLTDWHGLERQDGQALDTLTSDGYGVPVLSSSSRANWGWRRTTRACSVASTGCRRINAPAANGLPVHRLTMRGI